MTLVNNNPILLAGYVVAIVLIHIFWGWVPAVIIIAVSSGWFWRFYTELWTTILGFLLNAGEMANIYYSAPQATIKMLELSEEILDDLPEYTLVVISLLLPVIFYYLAGVFSSHVYEIVRKIKA